ncbi:dihydrolipoamide acetyltransferase family protein [Paracoccus sp. p4-l81]|uniref:dihydrolipoamide acetyltransferase family protein n=1 Tax=unclassified Paracoccus (in: a-proteobacteria) TaxID=2688777 RepID=UPI0035B940B5
MTTDICVPLEQEGTLARVTRWLKAVGEPVAADEPIVELETDKVAVEVPAPCAGILAEIVMKPGTEADPGAVLGRMRAGDAGDAGAPAAVGTPTPAPAPRVAAPVETRHSPAVRKALSETGVDATGLSGSGRDGRLTRADVMAAAEAAKAVARSAPQPMAAAPGHRPAPATQGRDVPHDAMRLAIARNMVKSLTDAPQVTAVFEADFTAITAHRARHKAAFAADGINLSFMPYILTACAAAMRAVPQVNSRWHDDRLEVFSDVNIGIGTALGDNGLVVPVLRRVQDLSLRGIAAGLHHLTSRAREGRLTPADMQGGTFTISNHGVSGSLLAAPIVINAGQAAILGVGKLEKRVVVRTIDGSDAIVIRPMAYVTLTIDHRVLDGFTSNAWLTAFVAALESWPDS